MTAGYIYFLDGPNVNIHEGGRELSFFTDWTDHRRKSPGDFPKVDFYFSVQKEYKMYSTEVLGQNA